MENFINYILRLLGFGKSDEDKMLKQKESYIQIHDEKNIEYEAKGIPKMPYPDVWWNPYKKVSNNIPNPPKSNNSKIYK